MILIYQTKERNKKNKHVRINIKMLMKKKFEAMGNYKLIYIIILISLLISYIKI